MAHHPPLSAGEKLNLWWTYEARPRKAVVITSVVAWSFAIVFLYADAVEILSTRPWSEDLIVALAIVAVPVLAILELSHSAEANRLRAEANRLREQNGRLNADLNAERNKHLQQIADNTKKAVTQTERNAVTLRRHLRANVAVVNQDGGTWPSSPEIAEVSEDNIVALFSPRTPSSGAASCVYVRCDDLEIVEIPQGGCPLRLKMLKRYGDIVQLGEITKWEDRLQPTAAPTFAKGGMAYHATYSKPGSSETRTLYVYAAKDGSNSFLLEASTGARVIGNNEEISKRFSVLQIEYEAAGFGRSGCGTGGSLHRLFIR